VLFRSLRSGAPKELRNFEEEISLLPKAVRTSHIEDALLDSLISELVPGQITSYEDSKLYVLSKIWSWIEKTDVLVAQDVVSKHSQKLWLYISGRNVPDDSTLSKLLKATKIANSGRAPLMVLSRVGDKQILVIRIPALAQTNETQWNNIGHLISFAQTLLGLEYEGVKVVTDNSLGTEVLLPASLQKVIDSIKISAQDPKGLYPGEIIKFKTGFEANLVGLLAAMRILSLKLEYCRKRQAPKSSDSLTPVSFGDLQDSFNIRSGIKSDKPSYAQLFVKAVLALCVKPSNKRFPGGWLYAIRQQNRVNTDNGVLFKMGYTEKVSSHHKLLEVLFNPVLEMPGDRVKAIKNNSSDNISYIEFRSAVAMSLPKIDASCESPMDKQVSVEPLNVKDTRVLENFSDLERIQAVDRLNTAYALKIACYNKKSKTTPAHYEQARNAFLNCTSRCALKDAGNSYKKFSEVPESTQGYLRKKFRYPKSDRKRPADTFSVEAEAMEEDGIPSTSSPPSKGNWEEEAMADGGTKVLQASSEGVGLVPLPPPQPVRRTKRVKH